MRIKLKIFIWMKNMQNKKNYKKFNIKIIKINISFKLIGMFNLICKVKKINILKWIVDILIKNL
jgi:hypothetical protein